VLHSEEEGVVVDIINDKMIMIEVKGVKFPAYMDQIDFPYFKMFSQKKSVSPKKTYVDQIKAEKNQDRIKSGEGVSIKLIPVYQKDVFDDDIIEKLKLYLINQNEEDYQFNYNESEPLNNVQLKGFAERGPGALEAVEDYKMERDRVKKAISEMDQTATPVATPTSTSNETAAPTTNNQNTGPQLMNPSSDSTNKLNTVTSENLELNLPSTPESVVNSQITNNTNVNSTKGQRPKGPIPSVRNMEDSFQRMVFDSLRVV
jgi:hypothetical protein